MKYQKIFRTYHGFTGQRMLILPLSVVNRMDRDKLFSDFYIHSMGHMPYARNQVTERPEGAPEYQLIYCTGGKGFCVHGDTEFTVSKNQAFIFEANVPHYYEADKDDPWSFYWVHFKGEKAAYLASGMERPVDVPPDFEHRIALFDEAYNTLKSGYSKENLVHACMTLGYFISSFRNLSKPVAVPETKNSYELGASVIHWATHYMETRINQPLKLKDISDYTGYSPRHLYRLFLKETELAPIKYFHHLKIERACEYLSNGNYKVAQVARILGFRDAAHFSKLFIKVKGVPPGRYRKETVKK